MKNCSILLALMLLTTSIASNAQEKEKKHPHEISIGYGNWSNVQLLDGVHAGEGGYSETPIDHTSGIISIAYRYHVTPWLFVGIGVACEYESGIWNTERDYIHVIQMGKYKRAVYSIAPELGISYSHDRPVTTYGYVSAGGSYLNEVDAYSLDYYNKHYSNGVNSLGKELEIAHNRHDRAVQICPIALSFGKRMRGFAELGFGYKGILNGGVKMRL